MELDKIKRKREKKPKKKQNIVSASVTDEQMAFILQHDISVTALMKTVLNAIMKKEGSK